MYQFSVIDNDDTYTVEVLGGIPAGSNLTYDKGVYIFTWTLRQVQNVSLTFYAVDSLNASAQLAIPVLICACQNGGNCTLNESLDANVTSVVMTCECLKGAYYSNYFLIINSYFVQLMMVLSVRRTEMDVWTNSATVVSSATMSQLLGWVSHVDHVPMGTLEIQNESAQVMGL